MPGHAAAFVVPFVVPKGRQENVLLADWFYEPDIAVKDFLEAVD